MIFPSPSAAFRAFSDSHRISPCAYDLAVWREGALKRRLSGIPLVTSKGRPKPSLNSLSRLPVDMDSFFEELRGDSDRACSLVTAAALSDLLQKLLGAHFIRLTQEEQNHIFFEQHASLGDFASRIEISYACGLISKKERDSLNVIRRIRNQFAHTVAQINFSNEIIRKECDKLRKDADNSNSTEVKDLFLLSALTLYQDIINRCSNSLLKQTDRIASTLPPNFLMRLQYESDTRHLRRHRPKQDR